MLYQLSLDLKSLYTNPKRMLEERQGTDVILNENHTDDISFCHRQISKFSCIDILCIVSQLNQYNIVQVD